jgi:SNF2-related domain
VQVLGLILSHAPYGRFPRPAAKSASIPGFQAGTQANTGVQDQVDVTTNIEATNKTDAASDTNAGVETVDEINLETGLDDAEEEDTESESKYVAGIHPRTTLIVTSKANVIRWEQQIKRYVNVDAESPIHIVDRHLGSGKANALQRIVNGELDIVLTTYDTLLSDFRAAYPKGVKPKMSDKKRKAAQVSGTMNLFIYIFNRVVLDAGTYSD